MPIDCATARDQIDAAALGALDADEAQALHEHLAGCMACEAEAAEAREAASSLGLAVPLAGARPGLKARVMGSAAVLSDIDGHRRARPRWWFGAGAAAAVALIAGLAAWGIVLQLRVDDLDSRNEQLSVAATAQSSELAAVEATLDLQESLVEIMARSDTRSVQLVGQGQLAGATADYLWSPSERMGALIAQSLPREPDGMTYRLWIVEGDDWTSGGDFRVDDDGSARLVFRPERQRDDGETSSGGDHWYCVTLEPEGTTGRSGDILLTSAP